MKTKFTTVALDNNQYLIYQGMASIVEAYCIGYTNGKKDKSITGYYFVRELIRK